MTEPDELIIDEPDEWTRIVFIEVPGSKVVMLQAMFESYEGVGVVRTIDIQRGVVCIITTPSQLDDCLHVLDALKPLFRWKPVPLPSEEERARYVGYFRRWLSGQVALKDPMEK